MRRSDSDSYAGGESYSRKYSEEDVVNNKNVEWFRISVFLERKDEKLLHFSLHLLRMKEPFAWIFYPISIFGTFATAVSIVFFP